MDISYFIRAVFFIAFLSLKAFRRKSLQKINFWVWRAEAVYCIINLILLFSISEPPIDYWIHTLTLTFDAYILFPFLGQKNCCDNCGHRMYWWTLFSNKCPNCKEKIYQTN